MCRFLQTQTGRVISANWLVFTTLHWLCYTPSLKLLLTLVFAMQTANDRIKIRNWSYSAYNLTLIQTKKCWPLVRLWTRRAKFASRTDRAVPWLTRKVKISEWKIVNKSFSPMRNSPNVSLSWFLCSNRSLLTAQTQKYSIVSTTFTCLRHIWTNGNQAIPFFTIKSNIWRAQLHCLWTEWNIHYRDHRPLDQCCGKQFKVEIKK